MGWGAISHFPTHEDMYRVRPITPDVAKLTAPDLGFMEEEWCADDNLRTTSTDTLDAGGE